MKTPGNSAFINNALCRPHMISSSALRPHPDPTVLTVTVQAIFDFKVKLYKNENGI